MVASAETAQWVQWEAEAGGRSWLAGSPPGDKQTNNLDGCLEVWLLPIVDNFLLLSNGRRHPQFSATAGLSLQVLQGARLERIF